MYIEEVNLMKYRNFLIFGLIIVSFFLTCCSKSPIVGTWFVKASNAPFPYHLFIFHSDGTVQQSNPDAGDPNTSDSNLMGVWQKVGRKIEGNMIELTADRTTRQFVSRGVIFFSVEVEKDVFKGRAIATFYDINGRILKGPFKISLEGEKILFNKKTSANKP